MDQTLLKPEAEALVRAAIGSISGVAIMGLEEYVDDHDGPMARITLRGWSPSLNLLTMTWYVEITADGAERHAERMLGRLGMQMDIQRDRLRQGLALGTAAPFGVASMDGDGSGTNWSHILVDRGLAALMEQSRPGGLGREVSDSVFDLHQPDQGHRDGFETYIDGESIGEDDKPLGRHMLRGRTLTHDFPVGKDALYDGARLLLPTRVPETLLTAAVGRALGEMVEAPSAIAGHIVTGGSTGAGSTEILVEPRLATAGELLDEIAAGGIRPE